MHFGVVSYIFGIFRLLPQCALDHSRVVKTSLTSKLVDRKTNGQREWEQKIL